MTTKDWAKELRDRQDAQRRRLSDNHRAIEVLQGATWNDLREELSAGIEGYGSPPSGRFEKSPADHEWRMGLVEDTPNRNTTLREVKVVHKREEQKIAIS